MTVRTEPETTPATPVVRRRGRAWRLVAWLLVAAVAAAVVVPLAAFAQVVAASRATDAVRTDVVVVLGASQFWGKPSPVLEARLARGHELYEQQVAPRILTVGGKQPGDRTTEAAAGRAWLTSQGVTGADVVAVPEGRDTLQSLTAVARVMSDHGWQTATIVTDPAHEARSLAIARALGIDAHGAPTLSGAGSGVTFDYLARESAGLAWFWVGERRTIAPVVAS